MKRTTALVATLVALLAIVRPVSAQMRLNVGICDTNWPGFQAWLNSVPLQNRDRICLSAALERSEQLRVALAAENQRLASALSASEERVRASESRAWVMAHNLTVRERELGAERRTAGDLQTAHATLKQEKATLAREKDALVLERVSLLGELSSRDNKLAEVRRDAATAQTAYENTKAKKATLESRLREFSERLSVPVSLALIFGLLFVVAIVLVVSGLVRASRGKREIVERDTELEQVRGDLAATRKQLAVPAEERAVLRAAVETEVRREMQSELDHSIRRIEKLETALQTEREHNLQQGLAIRWAPDRKRVMVVDTEVPEDEGKSFYLTDREGPDVVLFKNLRRHDDRVAGRTPRRRATSAPAPAA
jgi:hypothetical protein